MAAAEYYNPGAAPQQGPPPAFAPGPAPQQQRPPQQQPAPSQSQASLAPPYPLADGPPGPPPPYQAYHPEQQRPHSQPPPSQRIPQQHVTFAGQGQPSGGPGGGGGWQYPPPPNQQANNTNTHQYPPEKAPAQPPRPSTLQNMYRPSDYTSSHPAPQQMNGYSNGPTAVAPGLGQIYGSEYGSNPPRRDSRSPRRHHHSSHRPQERPSSSKGKAKGSSANTFLGAGGGAIIGDLIFPGLGTIGGALLGGVGGHEYTKKKSNQRSQSNPNAGYRRSGSYSGSGEKQYYDDDYRRGRNY